MKHALTLLLTLFSITAISAADQPASLNGKTIELTAPCNLSKVPDAVYVQLAKKRYKVELGEKYAMKFKAGNRCWIGLTGIVHDKPIGKSGRITQNADGSATITQWASETADGSIEVIKIHFLDQKEDRKESLKVLDQKSK